LSSSQYTVEVDAISLWGLIHGLVLLVIEGQIPSNLMKQTHPKDLIIAAFQQIVRVPIHVKMLK